MHTFKFKPVWALTQREEDSTGILTSNIMMVGKLLVECLVEFCLDISSADTSFYLMAHAIATIQSINWFAATASMIETS